MISEILNVDYFDKSAFISSQNISIKHGKIEAITAVEKQQDRSGYVIPGLVDLQIYGAGGKLFSANPSVDALIHIENSLLQTGTTAFLICLATNTAQVFNECISVVKAHREHSKNCLGLHLEGPFLNPKRRGAHVENFIKKATLDEVKRLLDFADGTVKMMTIAPELQDEAVIQYLLDQGVVLSLGHSDATFDEATAAFNGGVQATTHLFNAMTPIHHRNPGIPTAVFNHDSVHASIIADGHHVDFEVVRMSKKLMGDRLFLITDAVTSCQDGPYQHQRLGDKFVMPDGTLSGSALTQLQAVKNCTSYAGISLVDAINMASKTPLKLIGMEHLLGTVEVGKQANLLVLDAELNLKKVIFKGEEY